MHVTKVKTQLIVKFVVLSKEHNKWFDFVRTVFA